MVRGGRFYAIWNPRVNLWSTREFDVAELIDADLYSHVEKLTNIYDDPNVIPQTMQSYDSKSWDKFRQYTSNIPDSYYPLDDSVTFASEPIKKDDHKSMRLSYDMDDIPTPAYDELMETLYSPSEREKIEWAIGSILFGDSSRIHKFLVFYGESGSGKSTVISIIEKLFEGYTTVFDAQQLAKNNNQFAASVFKMNPLVGIQHDGDLSKIEDNTTINSIVSHEEIVINEKYKSGYPMKLHTFLFMGTNKPVKITDAKSGLLRRLIDVSPTGNKIPFDRYQYLVDQINFEIPGIAQHCYDVYKNLGMKYYNSYRPTQMMQSTDLFYNFVEEHYSIFKSENGTTLKKAYDMYKVYCEDSKITYPLNKTKFKSELANYFKHFDDGGRAYHEGVRVRNVYSGFLLDKFSVIDEPESEMPLISLKEQPSLFEKECGDYPAQYATENGSPKKKWEGVNTKLNQLDTSKLHYVMLPENHIVIDFDLVDETGEKSLQMNLEAAANFPLTYSEVSKSGNGLHLHYYYNGDVSQLSRLYSEGIEIKVFTGNSSLRRKLTRCNNLPIKRIATGLPLKEVKVINFDGVKTEKKLRDLIQRNFQKEFHPGTKPSIDFIFKLLEDAYKSGIEYDVTDLRPKILAFAANSTNQSEYCVNLVSKMVFQSDVDKLEDRKKIDDEGYISEDLIFFDVEVFPNLFIICWKAPNKKTVKMINPSSEDVENLLKFKLVGFNNRRYDNHILYARYLGYDNQQLYDISSGIVNGSRNATFREAYNLSYTDVYDFSNEKKSLKKFEVELGIHHSELDLPWDEPVDESLWEKVADYCVNDVIATEKTFEAKNADWIARNILSDISGLNVNATTNTHTGKIIFGDNRKPHDHFVYTDLSEMFTGYKFDFGKSFYRDEEVGEGGYIHAEPGMYTDVALLDVESMHPNSAINMNIFGDKYTSRFKELVQARLAIKHGDYEKAGLYFDGKLKPYLKSKDDAKGLSYALKIAINSVYGMTSAGFENIFRDPRNVDNIVAKRGALFMIDLKHAVQEKGFVAAHIKTDSIKIPNATKEIIDFVMEFGKKYGYTFEHEATYSKLCLINDSTYVALDKSTNEWTSTGAQLIHPYVFKTLFSHKKIELKDMVEVKEVKTSLYLDMNENLGEDDHNYQFVGRIGAFIPVISGVNGGQLMRKKAEGGYGFANGTKGHRWLEYQMVEELKLYDNIDMSYYRNLVDKAFDKIAQFGDAEWFIQREELAA